MKINQNILHPWHGVKQPEEFPQLILAYIEITPIDTVKYEIDKESGLMMVDRPQKFSNFVPALYGFLPKTFCGQAIANLANQRGMNCTEGDGDPLDILVLSSHPIGKNGLLVKAKPIGGLGLQDSGEADDKIIAVLDQDPIYSIYKDISELPEAILDKLRHYFLTYKNLPHKPNKCTIAYEYGRDDAIQTILKSTEDYKTLNY